MKIYLLADMEGISGIRKMEQVKREFPDYSPGCRLMMDEINVAIDALFAAGATEVVACDTHGGGGQVQVEEMDPRAVYETPNAGVMMPSLDASFAGLVLLGHHARAGTLDGFLDHTMDSSSWFEYRINGQVVGEIGIEAAYAAHFGVPVIAVTGDEATAREAQALLGPVACAVVKKGIGRNRARCLSQPVAHARIRECMTEALAGIGRIPLFRPSLPATIELTFYRSDMADAHMHRPGIERVDGRTIRMVVSELRHIRPF